MTTAPEMMEMNNDDFVRAAFAAAESPVGGAYVRQWLREAARRLDIANEIARERERNY